MKPLAKKVDLYGFEKIRLVGVEDRRSEQTTIIFYRESSFPQKADESKFSLLWYEQTRTMSDSCYFDALILRFDGGCRGQYHNSGSGWILMDVSDNEKVVAEGCFNIGPGATSNIAEYFGLIKGLEFLVHEQVTSDRIHIQGDSELVINQMLGIYKVRNPHLLKLFAVAKSLCGNLDCGRVKFTHIDRGLNSHADRLAGIAIEEGTTGAYWV